MYSQRKRAIIITVTDCDHKVHRHGHLRGDGDKTGIKDEPVNAARPYKSKAECPDAKPNRVAAEDAGHSWPQTHLRRSVLL